MFHGIAFENKAQCLVTVVDVTQRHLAVEALSESEEKYRTITDSTTDIIFIIDKTGKQIFFNEQVEHILGYKSEELIGRNFSEYVPAREMPKYLTQLSNVFFHREVKHFKTQIYHKDGRMVDVEINGRLVRQNGKLVGEGTIKDITGTKRAEEALRKSEERFSLAMDAANDGLWDWEVSTENIYFSPGCYRMLGYEPNDFESTWDNWRKLIHPDDLESVIKNIRNYRENSGHSRPNEFRAKAKDGSWHWLLSRGKIVERDIKGKASRVIGTHVDITERKHANEALLEERQRLSNVVKGINAGIWEWNIQTGETIFNDRWAEILGYTLAEISPVSNQTWNNFSHPDDLKTVDSLLEKHFRGELDYYDCQVRMRHKDGRWIWTLHRGKVISWTGDGKPLLMSGTHQDINDHKMAEEALLASEQRARALLDAIPDFMLICNHHGDILDYKPAIGCYFPEENIIGKNLSHVIPPEMAELIRGRIAEIIETGKMRVDEYHFNLPAMGAVNFEARSARGIHDEVIIIVRNISKRKKTEAEIQQKNQELQKLNATKDKFFSIIAHDLKSPFNSIVGFSDLLIDQVKENDLDGIESYAEIIQKSSNRAMDLLTNLMEWSRSQTGRIIFKPESCDLFGIINETSGVLLEAARQKSIDIKNEVLTGTMINADKAMIGIILRNLVANAIKFTNTGGWIKLSARKYTHETIVTVHDNGVGISEANIEKLFRIDENYTTSGTNKEQGTGLGLILCNEFIEKHGGRIWVKSQVGHGSAFSFSLPV